MGNNVLTRNDIEKIVKETLKKTIQPMLEDYIIDREKKIENISLLERVVRVEEGILRIEKHFETIDKRFEDMYSFIDKRFEDMYSFMDKRFEDMNKRIGFIGWFVPTIITIVVAVLKFIQI